MGMSTDPRATHKTEMAFFKDALTKYNSALDGCGDIRKSLSLLKKQLEKSGKRIPTAKWARLYGALMSGEITRGKKSTPGDWAAREAQLLRATPQ